jgi:hypothetical protein
MKPILQIAAIALGLGVVAAAASGRLAGWFAEPEEARVAGAGPAPTSPATSGAGSCLDEAELRRVIREELAAAAAARVPEQGAPAPASAAGSPAPPASADRVESVNRQVDEYIRAGVISESEMARLQSDIARLDPTARRAALEKLVRAMNAGALDGHL